MKKLYDIICLTVFVGTMIICVIFPKNLSFFVIEALDICIKNIIPSLFPLIFINQILSRTGIISNIGKYFSFAITPLFGVPKELCGAFITGLISGIPNGAHATGITYSLNLCSKTDAERCIALSNNCSIPFLLTVTGINLFGGTKNSLIFIMSQIISLILTALVLKIVFNKKNNYQNTIMTIPPKSKYRFSSTVCKSIAESCTVMLNICGFIIIFYIISGLIISALNLDNISSVIIKGMLEVSSGIIGTGKIAFPLNIIICSAIIGFSGLSAIFQVTDASLKYGLSAKQYVFSRIVNGIIMPVVTALIVLVAPANTVTAFAYSRSYQYYSQTNIKSALILYALYTVLVILVLIIIYTVSSLLDKKYKNTKIKID